ncbi:hypothetical protein CPB84DRAFT_1702105 [Gymnopilus junonius]|uniref:Nitrogen regulatory protein areA GATA-like domain-containing protein n=1 Tax=Gymnopilus junonius TaxID=109634 RepID=A0A9P5NY59_GYMJU|nr:hypothetical protein CPB84DRAFT_1702105 [Gymnopilus junonius]
MVVNFPIPVLSVAADAVRDLEGRDALYGLWTLFTKCKESLQDGRRLENISWRLWYRELMLLEEERKSGLSGNVLLLSEKEKKIDYSEVTLDEKLAYQPPTPSEAVPIPPPSYTARESAAARNSSPKSPHLVAGS